MTKRMSFKFKWVALVATLIVGIGSWQVLAHADSSSDEPIVTLGSSLTSSRTGINTLTASLNGAVIRR